MTHLRRVMPEELQRRNYTNTTVQYYIQAVERFAEYFHRTASSSTHCGVHRDWKPLVARPRNRR